MFYLGIWHTPNGQRYTVGKRSGTSSDTSEDSTFRRLPFDHCCVSLQPFEHPYCDANGNVFELEAVLQYIKHLKHNPVTGKPLDGKSLTKLTFYKNAEDQYHCPVLFKTFTKHSHIVAIKTTGNVYSFEVSLLSRVNPRIIQYFMY